MLDPVSFGKLLAAELPRPIQNDPEFERMVAAEELDFAKAQIDAGKKRRFGKFWRHS
jgi:hypothetical protein